MSYFMNQFREREKESESEHFISLSKLIINVSDYYEKSVVKCNIRANPVVQANF